MMQEEGILLRFWLILLRLNDYTCNTPNSNYRRKKQTKPSLFVNRIKDLFGRYMKYIYWVINREELKSYSLDEFDQDDGSIYGFLVFKLGDFSLGFISSAVETSDGDEDISFYVDQLIKCGISLLKGDMFSVGLLNSNLLEIRVHLDKSVIVEVHDMQCNISIYTYDLSLDDFISEIKSAYMKYIDDVKEINESILQSKRVCNTSALYENFLKT